MLDVNYECYRVQKALERRRHRRHNYLNPVISLFCRSQRVFVSLLPDEGGAAADAMTMIPLLGADSVVYVQATQTTPEEWSNNTGPRLDRLSLTRVSRDDEAVSASTISYPYTVDDQGKPYWLMTGSDWAPIPLDTPVVAEAVTMLRTGVTRFNLTQTLGHLRRTGHHLFIGRQVARLHIEHRPTLQIPGGAL